MDRTPRLAEFVVHLTGCSPRTAIDAIARASAKSTDTPDSLELVARAICSLRRLDLTEPVDLREPAHLPVR
jgi:hypothetical protein